MLYHLFKYFDNVHNLPGAGMFQYISFRAAAAIIIALLIVIVFGRNIINFLRRKQIGEEIRDLGLEGQLQKKGTPTMGGVIILLAILVPVLLFGQLDNVYIQLMLVSTIWLGLIGFLDDYIKVFRHHKEGLKGRFKIVGQVGLGIIVGTTMCFSPDIVVREKTTEPVETIYLDEHGRTIDDLYISQPDNGEQALEIAEQLIRSSAIDIIVIDSVAALTPKAEIEGDMGDNKEIGRAHV